MKSIIFFVSILYFLLIPNIFGKERKNCKIAFDNITKIDTLKVQSKNYRIIHSHQWSKNIDTGILKSSNIFADIFNDTFNTFSRLIIVTKLGDTLNIPTIPLKYLIIKEKVGIIIGLSDFVKSPYNIVLYSLDGKLLFKRRLEVGEIKLNKDEMVDFREKFPNNYECLLSHQCLYKEGDFFYIGLPCNCYDYELNMYYSNKGYIKGNHYFHNMSISTYNPSNDFKSYSNLFSKTDPFYDILMLDSIPLLLILNSEDEDKVHIPTFNLFEP